MNLVGILNTYIKQPVSVVAVDLLWIRDEGPLAGFDDEVPDGDGRQSLHHAEDSLGALVVVQETKELKKLGEHGS